ncbi:hypothetical protein [Streptomyces sp. SID3343]|uniref:hypothetical protein n=1 Tax=Streptomyces sp. SID3343 TaxID=2690260 RepID=UPI001367CF1A|nr:hypothetical protein [Streptomyces sp. SID3343]MYW06713.1 hypothetical protein [Streptomyces sp. SID3343]
MPSPDQAAYGYGATFVTSSTPMDPGALASFVARVDLYAFECQRESNDGGFSDEIYWALSSAGRFGRQERITPPTITNVDKGERKNFDRDTVLLHGNADTAIVCHIAWSRMTPIPRGWTSCGAS